MSIFSSVADFYKVKLNKFDLSKERLVTADLGKLYPVYARLFTPKSFIRISPSAVAKTAPMFAPIYGSYTVRFHAFAVPLRLLWSGFYDWIYNPEDSENMPPHVSEVKFITDVVSAAQTSKVVHPLFNDFRIPFDHVLSDNVSETSYLSIWHFLAYHKIYSDYFRNENLEDELDILADVDIQDYDDFCLPEWFTIHHYVNYYKDYFTSALTSAQKGTQAFISVLQSLTAPVNVKYAADKTYPQLLVGDPALANQEAGFGSVNSSIQITGVQSWSAVNYLGPDNSVNVYADLSDAASGISAADFRSLMAVQSYLEQLAVGGSRYIESTLGFYGSKVKDARAQRPEYLGCMQTLISPKEVVANMPTDIGQLGGVGQGAATGNVWRYYASEHTCVMVVMSIVTNSLYCQGLPKEFRLLDQFDYPLPMFQHLGEEPIKNEEIFWSGITDDDSAIFGYQSRYAYWRSDMNDVCGEFCTTLKNWHLARFFKELPSLNKEFIEVNGNSDLAPEGATLDRVFNYSGDASEHFWISLFFDVKAKLPFKYHSKPMLIG